jgi:hypothetical protein
VTVYVIDYHVIDYHVIDYHVQVGGLARAA